MSPLVVHVDVDILDAHHSRMRRVALATLVVCLGVGVVAPIVSVYLSIVSLIAGVGLIVAGDMLIRARRGLLARRAIDVSIAARRVTVRYTGDEPHVVEQPILGGQAFPSHIQLVAGTPPGKLVQVEIPLLGAARSAFLDRLRREQGIEAPDRRPVGLNLAYALTVVPALVVTGYLVVRFVMVTLALGVIVALRQLGPEASIVALLVLALAGALVVLRRLIRPPDGRG